MQIFPPPPVTLYHNSLDISSWGIGKKKTFPKAIAGGWIPQDGRLPPLARGTEHGRAEPRRGSVGIQPGGLHLLSLALTAVGAEVQICSMHFENVRD